MGAETLAVELSHVMALPEREVVRKGLFSLIEKEIRMAELEIADIRERYDVFSLEALYQAIQDGMLPEHPAWEDYIVWKNKEAHMNHLRQLVEKE
ncbi:MAG: hypothetical protein H8D37_02665 [Chloroflexi bacterium]|nr:hypothetical protein [Chloroflexota bacterium]